MSFGWMIEAVDLNLATVGLWMGVRVGKLSRFWIPGLADPSQVLKEESLRKDPEEVFSAAIMGGLAIGAGLGAAAMMLAQLLKK